MTSDKTIVLIVEDDPAIAELVRYSLREDNWVCCCVPDVAQAWDFMQRQVPQLVMLDWMLRNESGLKLLARIRADRELRRIPVLLLTARTLDEDRSEGLGRGADDFMTKPFSPRELLARAKAALRRKGEQADVEDAKDAKDGEDAQDARTLQVGSLSLDPLSYTVRVDAERVDVRQAEFRLLKFLLAHPGRVFSRDELLEEVWQAPAALDPRTVDVHVLRLRKALGKARPLIRTVRNAGYMLAPA
jgi:two-component system phosphate regulon response regulator PhoB